MKYRGTLLFLLLFMFCLNAASQSIIGKWKTVDDKTGEEKSIVEIFERNGKIFGKIIEIFDPSKKDLPCIYCKGADYNKPVLGLEIIKSMKKNGNTYKDGTITDPQDGKTYTCRLQLTADKNKLQVRGYIAFFYATQYWIRIND